MTYSIRLVFSITPGNIRKPLVSGGIETSGMKCVKLHSFLFLVLVLKWIIHLLRVAKFSEKLTFLTSDMHMRM